MYIYLYSLRGARHVGLPTRVPLGSHPTIPSASPSSRASPRLSHPVNLIRCHPASTGLLGHAAQQGRCPPPPSTACRRACAPAAHSRRWLWLHHHFYGLFPSLPPSTSSPSDAVTCLPTHVPVARTAVCFLRSSAQRSSQHHPVDASHAICLVIWLDEFLVRIFYR
jgi:hypothetical protein